MIIDTLALWLAHIYIRFGIMRVWSKFISWLYERKTQEPLPSFASMSDLVKEIRTLKWRMDSWRGLFDWISSVGAIAWRMKNDPKKAIGDCDEFGRLSACVIRTELRRPDGYALLGAWDQTGINTTWLLTVMWKKTGGEEWEGNRRGYGGHNVCLIQYLDGTWAYMDYDFPTTRRATVEEVVKDIRDRYAQEYLPLGWGMSEPWTLKAVRTSRE